MSYYSTTVIALHEVNLNGNCPQNQNPSKTKVMQMFFETSFHLHECWKSFTLTHRDHVIYESSLLKAARNESKLILHKAIFKLMILLSTFPLPDQVDGNTKMTRSNIVNFVSKKELPSRQNGVKVRRGGRRMRKIELGADHNQTPPFGRFWKNKKLSNILFKKKLFKMRENKISSKFVQWLFLKHIKANWVDYVIVWTCVGYWIVAL